MVKRKVRNYIIGVLLFLLLIGTAFSVSFLFGIIFVIGFLYETFTGALKRRPFLAVALFVGGLIIRIALKRFLFTLSGSQTIIDLAIAVLLFVLIFIVGYKIKKGRL